MTMIDVDTSPLQAAREWRGISIVAAAMSSGLTMAQAEALEAGDPEAFTTIDEMIASAVVYGASIGIGKDEATALLDRTVCGTGAQVELPDLAHADARPAAAFSGAVQERSARIADRDVQSAPILDPILDEEMDEDFASDLMTYDEERELDEPVSGPTPEQAVAASGEIHLDDAFGPEAPWERAAAAEPIDEGTGELAAWIDDREEYEQRLADSTDAQPRLRDRVGSFSHDMIERIVGSDRADAMSEAVARAGDRISDAARVGRERLRRSEHATLFVAIAGGALLIALVVAIGGALGGSDKPATEPGPADRAAATAAPADATTATTDTATTDSTKAADKKPAAMLAPAKITIDVFNAGSKKGYAKEVAAKLGGHGYKIGEVTNAKDYTSATIIHPKGRVREARVLARRTGVSTIKEAPGSSTRFTLVVA